MIIGDKSKAGPFINQTNYLNEIYKNGPHYNLFLR